MGLKRLLPYIAGLIVLAFALGSLPRSTPGGSIIFRSYWLLYIIYLAPILILGIMVGIIAFFALNWKDIAGAIGFKMAQNRKMRKKRSRYTFFIWLFMWAIAIVVLIEKPGTIFNHSSSGSGSNATQIIQGSASNSSIPIMLAGVIPAVSNLVQNTWFGAAFLGLLAVGGLVLVQSLRVAMKETSEMTIQEVRARRVEGLQAAQEAIELVDETALDPRTRIINCFHRLIKTVSRIGVPVSADQTARELEGAIRSTFGLDTEAIDDLTELFEEARYSEHEIKEQDAGRARECLESIAEELKVQLDK